MFSEQKIDNLPIHHSLRVFLEFVSYSIPLPYWLEYDREIDFSGISRKLLEKAKHYINKTKPVCPPYETTVPNKRGSKIKWLIPSTNDQILLQACVSVLAPILHKEVSDPRIFSYCFVDDPRQFQLFRNQLESWFAFQHETFNKLENNKYMLQLDLKSSFAGINRADFFRFLRKYTDQSYVIDLLKYLIHGFDKTDHGIPMINDSLFFLGNVYLSKVDRIIGKHLDNFIRFVDDYRLFGSSRKGLSQLYEKINKDLAKNGFQLNESKVKLGSKEEYLEAISLKEKTDQTHEEYYGDTIFNYVADPGKLVTLIAAVLANPARYLTIGYGRLLLAALRRLRVNAIQYNIDYVNTAHCIFVEHLGKSDIPKSASDLFIKFLKEKDETWRLVWLLYLMQDFPGEPELTRLLKEINKYGKVPLVVDLWKSRVLQGKSLDDFSQYDFNFHEYNYLEQGIRLYGER